jgi:hypothetical protein
MNKWHWVGLFFVASGLAYWRWPNMFRRGIWLKTSIAIRTMSPETYIKYIRGLGVLLIAAGVVSIVYGCMVGAGRG